MSSLVLTGDTSGQVTLAAPAVAGTTTITLPATTGTAIIADASANIQFNSGYGSVATAYGCRAWVNFTGSTAVIRASGNVSSVTRTSAGVYTVTFTTAMPNTSYTVNITSQTWTFVANDSSLATGSCVVRVANASQVGFDGDPICVLIFR
jgi:hypothetical protein